jgi:soluble lytic murein transglycosylase-like protein
LIALFFIKTIEAIAQPNTLEQKEFTKLEMLETIPEPKPVNIPPKPKTPAREAKKEQIAYNGNCYDYVDEMANKYKVDGEVMRRIIKAESGGNPNAKNKNSTASSCAQFINGTFIGWGKRLWGDKVYSIDRYDGKASVELMAYVISKGGLHNWNASKSKWDK